MNKPSPMTVPTKPQVEIFEARTALLVVVLLLIDGLHFVFARLLRDYLPPVTAAFFVLAVAAVEMIIFATYRGRFNIATFRRHAGFFLTIGAFTAISTALTYTSVQYIDPGTASLLQQTTTLFGLGFGVFWLRERLTPLQILGSGVCLLGVGIITFQPGDYLRLGALLILVSSFLYASHAAIVKRYGASMDFVEFFLWRVTSVAGLLFLLAAGQGVLQWPSGVAWLFIVLTGTVDVVISRSLYYMALRRLKVSIHALILTLSPVVAILWTMALFQGQPTLRDIIGGAAVLAGVALVTLNFSKP